jgi:glycine dehydrogenase subunit 2
MEQIAAEAAEHPERLHQAPLTTPVSRLDEARASREPKLRWSVPDSPKPITQEEQATWS